MFSKKVLKKLTHTKEKEIYKKYVNFSRSVSGLEWNLVPFFLCSILFWKFPKKKFVYQIFDILFQKFFRQADSW